VSKVEVSPSEVAAGATPDVELTRLSVVIPAYDEEQAIGDTVRRLRDACPDLEIVVVDDGSTDGTADALRSIEGVRVQTHERNRGYGASLKTGMRAARRPFVAWYDADGQHEPADLLNVVAPVLRGERDVVIGVRGAGSARQSERVVGKALLKWVAQLLTRQGIPDLNSGMRCFRSDVIRRYLHLLPDGFSASTTSTILALKRGWRVGHVPIKTRRREGKSKVRLVSDGLTTLHLIVRLVVLFEAFRVFSALGGGLMALGLIYGILVAVVRGEGFPTLAGTVVIAGLLTVFLGIIADQITELRKERFEDDRD
jgi:glycosyltransferase involved in cell wall biosynthesis